MSTLINISNYEVYYLDFLEGNLSTEESLAFEQFLALHPELKVEDDFLEPISEDISLDEKFINSLKTLDISESLNTNNYERYLIASVERILPKTKEVELLDFLAQHNELRSELELYQKTKLVADQNLIYSDKKKLKRGIILPMYVKFAAIAASLVLLFMAIPNTNNSEFSIGEKFVSSKLILPQPVSKGFSYLKSDGFKVENTQKQAKTNFGQANTDQQIGNSVENRKEFVAFKLENRKLNNLETSLNSQEISFLNLPKSKQFSNPDEAVVLASNEVTNLRNPAPIVTSKLSELLKRDVEFKTAKVDQKKKRFYLKIGSFELSRNVNSADELASN